MKVGLSFSRCLRDIIEDKVKYDDILVIVSRTNLDPYNDKHWDSVWEGIHAADTHILNGLITKIKVMIFAN